MRKILFLFMIVLLFSLFLLFSNSNVTIGRVWIDSTGKHKTDAEFVSLSEDGQTVTLKKTDGKETRIPYKNLSTRDQTYIQGLLKSQGKTSGSGAGDEADSEEASQTYPQREWSDNMGRRSLKAAFVSVSDGWDSIVTFKKDSGRTVKLPFDELSLWDQSYIQEIFKAQNAADDKETDDGKPVVGLCRDWQNSKGDQTMEASFLSLSEDGKTVLIQKRCGQRIKIPFSEFSSEDREYIQEQAEQQVTDKRKKVEEEERAAKEEAENEKRIAKETAEEEAEQKLEYEPLYGDKFLEIPFNPYVEKLPENFQGHDIKQLWDALQIDEKGEFESTTDYQKRLDDLRKKPLFGTVFLDSHFAVKGKPSERYDADREVFQISPPHIFNMISSGGTCVSLGNHENTQISTIDKSHIYGVVLDTDFKSISHFGQLSDVYTGPSYLSEKYVHVSRGIVFYNSYGDFHDIPVLDHKDDITLNMPKEQAKQVHMSILYVFELSSFLGYGKPYVYEDYRYQRPTLYNTTDQCNLTQCIYIKKLTWMLYDEQTGEIFTKIPIRGIQEVKIGL